MHVGLVMECDYRYGDTEQAAFEEAFAMADAAEAGWRVWLDGVWLAERHFAAPRDPLDPAAGRGDPVHRILRPPDNFQRHRVPHPTAAGGGGGQYREVLPLSHPVRMAEFR